MLILSRYVYSFFNLSLMLIILYLLVRFILTIQQDVEKRILEYSLGMRRTLYLNRMQTTISRDSWRNNGVCVTAL